MYRMSLIGVLLAGAALGMITTDALAATAQEQRQQKQAEIPRCARPLGNLAVEEPQRNWWTELKLGSPEALTKIFVQQSGSFSLLDLGPGPAAAPPSPPPSSLSPPLQLPT